MSEPLTISQLSGTAGGLGTDYLSALSDGGFTEYLGTQGIDANTLTGADLSAQMKGFTDSGGVFADPAATDASGLGGNLNNAVDTGLAVGQFGLGVASFLDSKKTAGLNRDLMNQNIANNAYLMKKGKEDSAHLASVFG